jgi:protease-4
MSTTVFFPSKARYWTSNFAMLRLPAVIALLGFLATASLAYAAADDQTSEEKPRNIIAVFHLDGPVTEVPTDGLFPMFGSPGISLRELVARLAKAADDSAVKAVVILPETLSLGSAQVEELRAAIALLRNHGKEVYVHADELVLSQYLLASGASRISVVPGAPVLIPGLHASSLHLRGLLDKIGVRPDFITEGSYKSAAEMFMREQPSAEADEMMNWLMDSWFGSFKDLIAQGRKVDAAKAQTWLDNGLYSAEQAKATGLIDAVEHRQEFEAMLKQHYGENAIFNKKYGRKIKPELDFSSPLAFLNIWSQLFGGAEKKSQGKPAVGVLYVNGPIMTGRGLADPFGDSFGAFSTTVREALEKAAADASIEAVVLRIDSPGGSSTASEIILDATKKLKAKKPFVVSMGDVAGSGGYYVACAADTIFADATTLTGSIGVVAGKMATTEMWKKVGITFKEYKRGKNAGILSSDEVFTDSERARMKSYMDDVYGDFKNHVTSIRGQRLKKPIDDLAGGRVYTGKQALELGLVDRIGTLSDAIAFAAAQAKMTDFDVRVVPEPKNFLEQLLDQATGGKEDTGHVALSTGAGSLLKLAMPLLQNLDPQKTASILSALRRLDILQREGVVLTMPEILAWD